LNWGSKKALILINCRLLPTRQVEVEVWEAFMANVQCDSANEVNGGLMAYFSIIRDPRIERTKKHLLIDILTIAICAVICGSEGWEDLEEFGSTVSKVVR
jgi:hypothetical protein